MTIRWRDHLALQGLSIVDLPNIARQVNKEVAWDIQYAPEETHTRVGHVPDYARVISLSGSPPADGKPDPALSLCQSVYTWIFLATSSSKFRFSNRACPKILALISVRILAMTRKVFYPICYGFHVLPGFWTHATPVARLLDYTNPQFDLGAIAAHGMYESHQVWLVCR